MIINGLFTQAAQRPTEIAASDERGQYTYQQLAAMASGLGMYIAFQTQASNVGIMLPASNGFIPSFYGTLLAGKCAVLINFLLGDREIDHVIADSGIDTVITIPQLRPRLRDAKLKVIDLSELPSPPPAMGAPKLPSPKPDDLAVLIYTSGTSGTPKGVMLSYGNLQSCMDAAIQHAQLKGEHRFLGVVPPFHALGLIATVLAPIQLGSQVVYLSRFSAVAIMNAIRQHQISLTFMVPSMYAALLHLKNASADDFKHIYAAISGGEPLPEAVRENFQKRFGIPLLEGYGLTETCGATTINVPHAYRAGSVGQPIPNVNIKIANDDGESVAVDETGEVWIQGSEVMKGYYHLPSETAAALTGDGYFKTGDLGKLDSDGYLYITGRKKELIIIAGEKASPREIEDVLMRHPAVADAAVLGKKDPSRGEVVVAFVVARENQTPAVDELRDFCRSQSLAQWKIPREIIFTSELPRTPTGKVLKRVLAEKLTN